jgi:group I intron endonuclease
MNQSNIKSGIYTITASSGKQYIGSAVHLWRRVCRHYTELKKNKHQNIKLQRQVNKYGLGSISFQVIEYCEPYQLRDREQYYIDSLNPFFNLCRKAYSSLGIKRKPFTLAHRQKLRLAKLGTTRIFSDIHRFNLSQSKMGEKNASAKLKLFQIDKIKKAKKQGIKTRKLVEQYGVSLRSIQRIIKGESYKNEI